ncbi:MAG TPA: tyrosine-type recombinase/integrase [Terrimicrobiaceae bacterium]
MNKSSRTSVSDRKKRYAWRPTGVANVYMRGKKYYYVKMNRGKRHFVPLADRQGRPVVDLAEAIRAASKVAINPFVQKPETLRHVISEFFEEKLRKREWEATTKQGHRHIYEGFVTSVTKSLGAITSRDLQQWYETQRARVSDHSAATYFACIASLFRWAHSARKIPHNPAIDVVIEKPEPAADRRFATYEQRDRLVATANDDHLKLFLILGFHFGLRRREIDHGLPSWIDLEQRLLRVRNLIRPDPPFSYFRVKNGKERTIPMSAEATEFFRHYLPKVPLAKTYLLHPEKVEGGANRYRYDMRRPFQEHVKAHGMEWLTIQGMRTTFASLLATTGLVSIQQIADWLGDTIKVTEDRYAHLLPRHDLIEKAFRDRVDHSGKSSNLSRSTAATKSSEA